MRWPLGIVGARVAGALAAGLMLVSNAAGAEKAEKPAKAERPSPTARSAEPTPDQRQREFVRLGEELKKLYTAKKYEEGTEICRKMIQVAPNHPLGHYNLACGLARLGKADEALAALTAAAEAGYSDPRHMQADEDLASLRLDKRFDEVLAVAGVNQRAGGGRYEKGDLIEGTRTLEGFPEDGLRWRIRMSPTATKDKPDRLVVWFHPSLASMNKQVEALAPEFLKRGYALMVFTHRPFTHWASDDAQKVAKTLEAVAKTEGLDATRPILMGLSAGGQMALQLWSKSPGLYGGLILNSAFPVRLVSGVQMSAIQVPVEEAVKKTPILVFLGEKDGGVKFWRQAETSFHLSGVPLSIRYVPGKGHQWLLEGEPLTEVGKWLQEVAAGKLPADPAPASAEKTDVPAIKMPSRETPAEKPAGETGPPPKATPAKTPAGKTPVDPEVKPKG